LKSLGELHGVDWMTAQTEWKHWMEVDTKISDVSVDLFGG
jgi:hypothetical protein